MCNAESKFETIGISIYKFRDGGKWKMKGFGCQKWRPRDCPIGQLYVLKSLGLKLVNPNTGWFVATRKTSIWTNGFQQECLHLRWYDAHHEIFLGGR